MSDVLTITDLETAKKHDTFHSEVITGRVGGLASGAEIDSATNAVTGQVQTTLPKVLRDVGFKPASFTFVTGGTLGVSDADKCIYNPAPAGDDNWYSWSGSLPHTVSPGTDPTAVGSGYIPRTDIVLRSQLTGNGGAGMVGIDMLAAYQLGTIGAQLVPVPNADNTGATDCTQAFNEKILTTANAGGGVLKPIPGTYKIDGTILLPSFIVLDLTGVTLTGNGANNLIENAFVIGGVLTSIISEHGTGFDGNGTHATFGSVILNGVLANAARGIRGHRMNFGCRIIGTYFDQSLDVSWEICHSWGMKITSCTVYAPAKNYNFVDWTEISGNSFEGLTSDDPGSYGLEINGGSYSLEVHSNGFHHLARALVLNGEMTNTVITSNHFEDCRYHISGDNQNKNGLQIKHNWMKANLATPAVNVIAVSLLNSKFGAIGPNFYTTDGVSGFDAHVICNSTDCIGNKIIADHSTGNSVDLTKYQVSITNKIEMSGGSNNPTESQPWIEIAAGTSGYTFEKYRSRYHAIANTIPLCTTVYSDSSIIIDTFVPTDDYGGQALVAFNFMISGTASHIIAGHICHGIVQTVVNSDYYTPGTTLPIIVTNNGGLMRIAISGAPVGGNITGWVKEI